MLFLAGLVYRHDRKPPLIRLPRVGLRGRPFKMWKLRTMRSEEPGGRARGATITAGRDDRITPIGARLRRYRFDELLQVLNVVRGEMALIGPRPETPEYVDMQDPRWPRVLSVRPGVIGPTQVLVQDWEANLPADAGATYRAQVLPHKLAVDEWYAANASPIVDAVVVVALAEHFLARRAMTVLHRRADRLGLPEAAVAAALRGSGLGDPPAPRTVAGRGPQVSRRRRPGGPFAVVDLRGLGLRFRPNR